MCNHFQVQKLLLLTLPHLLSFKEVFCICLYICRFYSFKGAVSKLSLYFQVSAVMSTEGSEGAAGERTEDTDAHVTPRDII